MKSRPPSGSLSSTELFEQKAYRFIRRQGLFPDRPTVLVGISGGADSVCLTQVLFRLREKLGLSLRLAHLDHCLRGLESKADAEYVRNLAAGLGVPCTIEERDVRGYARNNRLSLEEAAREVRYRFLAETARASGAQVVAVGHTQDDQVETVLLHILRGTGTGGLAGLRPLQEFEIGGYPIRLARPLLEFTHRQAEEYCRHLGLSPREDSSNRSLRLLRNRVRYRLLPVLREYNPAISSSLLRLAEIAAEDQQYLDEEGARAFRSVAAHGGQAIVLDKQEFRSLRPALQRQVLRTAILQLCGTLKDIEARHIRKVLEALDKPSGKRLDLPYDLVFAIGYDTYRLSRGKIPEESSLPPIQGECPIAVPGVTRCSGWRIEAAILPAHDVDPKAGGDPWRAFFDAQKAGINIVLRSLRRGDRFQPLGMRQFKTAAEFMLDAKIPAFIRRRIPILVAPRGILWLAGQRIDERFKVTARSREVLSLRLELLEGPSTPSSRTP
jgi:tRNA(Ile)-lysidine synthase